MSQLAGSAASRQVDGDGGPGAKFRGEPVVEGEIVSSLPPGKVESVIERK